MIPQTETTSVHPVFHLFVSQCRSHELRDIQIEQVGGQFLASAVFIKRFNLWAASQGFLAQEEAVAQNAELDRRVVEGGQSQFNTLFFLPTLEGVAI